MQVQQAIQEAKRDREIGRSSRRRRQSGRRRGGEEGEDGEKRGAIRVNGQAHGVARGFCGECPEWNRHRHRRRRRHRYQRKKRWSTNCVTRSVMGAYMKSKLMLWFGTAAWPHKAPKLYIIVNHIITYTWYVESLSAPATQATLAIDPSFPHRQPVMKMCMGTHALSLYPLVLALHDKGY